MLLALDPGAPELSLLTLLKELDCDVELVLDSDIELVLDSDIELSENGALELEVLLLEASALDWDVLLVLEIDVSLVLVDVSVDSVYDDSENDDSENDVSDLVVKLLDVDSELGELKLVDDEYEELLKLLGVLLDVDVLVLLIEFVGDE